MQQKLLLALLLTGISFLLFFTVVFFFWLYRRRCHTFFHKLGICGPTPNFFTGNLHCFKGKTMFRTLQEWTGIYGKCYGYYEGSSPVIVLSDVEAVKDVLVKQFYNFCSRKDYPLLPDPDHFTDCNMFLGRGPRWKRLRAISSPSFSAAKLKEMKPLMDKCMITLMKILEERSAHGSAFDIYDCMQGMTLDIIAETAFGIETAVQSDPNDEFLQKCRQFFASLNLVEGPALLIASLLLPEVKPLWVHLNFGLDAVRTRGNDCLTRLAEKIVQSRKQTKEVRPDILQTMLEAESKDVLTLQQINDADLRKLTHREIISNAILLLAAGFETTSTTLGYIVYLLALNPHVQERVLEEIDQQMPDKQAIPSYEELQNMKYLQLVIKETLRLYPVASLATSRLCMATTIVGDNIKIPRGTAVQIDVWSLHYDPELWGPVDPNVFYPERFLVDRHPMAYLPFGGGPKNCLGMRFALLEVKLALVMLLRRFTVLRCSKTEHPLQLKEGMTITPLHGVYVCLQNR